MQLRNGKSLSTHSNASTRPSYSHLSKMKLRSGNDTQTFNESREEKSQHNASSFLLKFPSRGQDDGLRLYVRGHQTIHIYRTEKPRPRIIRTRAMQTSRIKRWTKPVVVEKANQLVHTVCSKSVSEEAEQQVFGSPSAAWKNVSNKSPHRHCVSKDLANTIFVRGWAKPAIQLDFSFLRSCRQIYDEAELVPYKTSVFSFEESEALRSSRH